MRIFKTPHERVGYTLSHTPSSGTSLPASLWPATDHYRSTRWSRILPPMVFPWR